MKIQAGQTRRRLLAVAGVAELLGGLSFALFPSVTLPRLFGLKPDQTALMVGRVTGVALAAIGVACWGARRDPGSAAQGATLAAIVVYNLGAGFLLTLFDATGRAKGVLIWIAAMVHLALGGAFVGSGRRADAN